MLKGLFHPHRNFYDARERLLLYTGDEAVVVMCDAVKNCDHPEAVWFQTFGPMSTVALLIVLLQCDTSVYARWYLAYIVYGKAEQLESAVQGFAFLMGRYAQLGLFIEAAAEQNDRVGLYLNGNVWRAAELGHPEAMYERSLIDDKNKYTWLVNAAAGGHVRARVECTVACFKSTTTNKVKYTLGRLMKPFADIFVKKAEVAVINFYTSCHEKTRNGILTWLLCCRHRLSIYRDVALLIAHLVWDDRENC